MYVVTSSSKFQGIKVLQPSLGLISFRRKPQSERRLMEVVEKKIEDPLTGSYWAVLPLFSPPPFSPYVHTVSVGENYYLRGNC